MMQQVPLPLSRPPPSPAVAVLSAIANPGPITEPPSRLAIPPPPSPAVFRVTVTSFDDEGAAEGVSMPPPNRPGVVRDDNARESQGPRLWMPPPPRSVWLAEMTTLTSVRSPWFSTPPPRLPLIEFPLMVQLLSVNVPVFTMRPPPPQAAELAAPGASSGEAMAIDSTKVRNLRILCARRHVVCSFHSGGSLPGWARRAATCPTVGRASQRCQGRSAGLRKAMPPPSSLGMLQGLRKFGCCRVVVPSC